MHYILNDLTFWVMASLITSVINFGMLVALAVFIFTRKSGAARERNRGVNYVRDKNSR